MTLIHVYVDLLYRKKLIQILDHGIDPPIIVFVIKTYDINPYIC